MKRCLLTCLLAAVCVLEATALKITSIVPNNLVCDSAQTVSWTEGPSASQVKMITFSYKRNPAIQWRVYNSALAPQGQYKVIYNPASNPDTLVLSMYADVEGKKLVASTMSEFNSYPYTLSQNLYYDYCAKELVLQATTQRLVSDTKGEYMMAELYENDLLVASQKLQGNAQSSFHFHFPTVKFHNDSKYRTSVYATKADGKCINQCGVRTSESKKVDTQYELYISSAKVVYGGGQGKDGIELQYKGSSACAQVTVSLLRTDYLNNTTIIDPVYTQTGGSYLDKSVTRCIPYTYQLVAYDEDKNLIGKSNITAPIALSDKPAEVVEFSNLQATLGEYADRVLLSWENTHFNSIKQLRVKRALSTNPTQFSTIFTSDNAVAKNSYTDMSVKVGSYYLYMVEAVNEENCVFTSTTTPGFALAQAVVTGHITYGDNMGTSGVQVSAVLADEAAKFVTQGAFRSYGKSVGVLQFKDSLATANFTWQAWINPQDASKAVIMRMKNVLRLVWENNRLQVVPDNNPTQVVCSYSLPQAQRYIHAAIVQQAGECSLLIDGALVGSGKLNPASASCHSLYVAASDSVGSNGFNGLIDDMRLWSVALDKASLYENYIRILSGEEDGLFGYWKFDEQGLGCFVDYAYRRTTGRSGNHGKLLGSNTYSTQTPERLKCIGYTDSNGYYKIPGIPIEAGGVTYLIEPYKEGALFSPESRSVMLDQYNALMQNVDFVDNSSYTVYVRVLYKDTKVPVAGVGIRLDGEQCKRGDDLIETDVEGYASISVPKGKHVITLNKSCHSFSQKDGIGGGQYTAQFDADVEKAYAITLSDDTKVRVIGRVAGGAEEGQKAVGFGQSKNNIGVSKMVLRFQNEDLATCNLTPDGKTWQHTDSIKLLESYWSVEPHYAARAANVTKVSKQKNGNLWEWEIIPDPNTGEYMVDLYPENYQVVRIDYYNQPSGSKLDYSASFTPTADTTGLLYQTQDRKVPKYDYRGKVLIDSVSWSDSLKYDVLQNYILYNAPRLSVSQNTEGYFGEKEYTIGSQKVALYTTEGKYTVGKGCPVFVQDNSYCLNISTLETYYASKDKSYDYTFSDGKLTVLNDFGHVKEFKMNAGVYTYRFVAAEPRLTDDSDYRQYLSIYLTSDGKDYYWTPDLGEGNDPVLNNRLPGYVLGAVADPSSRFVTKGPDVVAFVLRDPPGSTSTATLSAGNGYSIRYSTKDSNGDDGSYHNSKGSWSLTAGGGGGKTSIGVIPGEIEEVWSLKIVTGPSIEWESYDYDVDGYTYNSQFQEDITTSNSNELVGSEGDLYVGNSLNYIFSEARKLDLKLENNKPVLYKYNTVVYGDSMATQFFYTQHYLEYILLPLMQTRIDSLLTYNANPDSYYKRESELFSAYPASVKILYLTNKKPGDKDYATLNSYTVYRRNASEKLADEVAFYIQSVQQWIKTLKANEDVKLAARNSGGKGKWSLQNYSFDGTHSQTYTKTYNFLTDSTTTRGYQFYAGMDLDVDVFFASHVYIATNFNLMFRNTADFEKVNNDLSKYGVEVNLGNKGYDYPSEETVRVKEHSSTVTVSYTLSDENQYSVYSVDVYTPDWMDKSTLKIDQNNAMDSTAMAQVMPVFLVRAGTTSCPHFPGDSTHYQTTNVVLNAATERGEDPKITIGKMKLQRISDQDPDALVALDIEVSENSNDPAGDVYGLRFLPGNGATDISASTLLTQVLPSKGKPYRLSAYLEHKRKDIVSDTVGIIVHSYCQYPPTYYGNEYIADTAWVAVSYRPVAPKAQLNVQSSTNVINTLCDSVDLLINSFGKNYRNLTDLQLQMRGNSDVQWQTCYYFALTEDEYQRQKLNYGPDRIRKALDCDSLHYCLRLPEQADGSYQLRIRADIKSNGVVLDTKYSDPIEVVKDVNAPYVLRVSPSDGILSLGDEISLTTNEDIAIPQIVSDKVYLMGVLNGQVEKEGHNRGLWFDGVQMQAVSDCDYHIYDRSFTIEGWTYYEGKAGTLFAQGRGSEAWFKIEITSDAHLKASYLCDGKLNEYLLQEIVPEKQWTHFAVVYFKDQKVVRILQNNAASALQLDNDGFNKNISESGLRSLYQAYGPICLGVDATGNNRYQGILSGIRLWSKALCAAEINNYRLQLLAGSEACLWGYWPLSDLEGGVATDRAQQHNLLTNADWYLYPGGYALALTDSDRVQFSAPGLKDVDDYTLAFWYKSPGKTNAALWKLLGEHQLSIEQINQQLVLVNKGQRYTVSMPNLFNNQWHHVALSVNRLGDANMYVDGKLAINTIGASLCGLNAGYQLGGVEATFDNLRIWHCALDEAAIKQLRHVRSVDGAAGLVDYFPFDKMNDLHTALDTCSYSIAGSKGKFERVASSGASLFTTDAALVDAKTDIERIIPTVVREDRGMQLALDEFDSKPYRLQDCELLAYVDSAAIRDLHGNYIKNALQWSVYVDNKRLLWDDDALEIEKITNADESFKLSFYNRSGQTQHFTIDNLPSWLTCSETVGTLLPLSRKTLEFTICASLPVGTYEESLCLTGSGNLTDRLLLKVSRTIAAPNWQAECDDAANTISMVAKVKINGYYPAHEQSQLAAFVNGKCIGVAQYSNVSGGSYWLSLCYVRGQEVEYRYWDAETGILYNNLSSETPLDYSNMLLGTPSVPVVLSAGNSVSQRLSLHQGYNWVSLNVVPQYTTVAKAFEQQPEVIAIKDQLGSLAYRKEGGEWHDFLGALKPAGCYSVQATSQGDWQMPGTRLDVASTQITLRGSKASPRWMWIAYTPSDPMSVTAAFGNFQPCENDIVKGQTGFAVYDSIYGWTGTLQTLQPGCCYKYLSSADRSFVYPSSSTISRRDATVVPAIEHFQFDPYKYPSSMVMFAQVADYIPAEGDELGYFVDGECRGGGVRITDSGKTLFYGHFYAQLEGDPVDVVLYKAATQTEHKIAEQFVFQTDGMIGSVEEPQLLHIYVTDVDNLELEQLSLYPSPMQSTLQVRSSQLPDKIELLDVTGVLRLVAHQTRQVDVSGLNAGVYTVRMHFGNRQIVRKMIKQ